MSASGPIEREVLVLGGGLAGLTAGLTLGERGARFRIAEKSERVGGFCQTEIRDGFSFDKTGHWLHLRDPGMRALVDRLLAGNLVTLSRSAKIYSHSRYTPYPYQVNTHELPPEVAAECVLGFIEAHLGPGGEKLRSQEPKTFGDFIRRHLGSGFAKHFMFPYNQKLWTVHPDELQAAWCGRFVPRPSLETVIKGSLGIVDEGGYNSHFLYPKEGGIEALPKAYLPHLAGPVDLNRYPVSIDWVKKTVTMNDGARLNYGGLISTIPLPELIALCDNAPDSVRQAARKLRATVVTYVNVAARGEGPAYHWVYFPEPEFKFYRVGSASAIYPKLAPAGTRSFYVEFSSLGGLDHGEAQREAIRGLLRAGLLSTEADVIFAFARDIHGAYVLYDRDYGPAKELITGFLRQAQIEVCGRYGNWEYGGMEDAMLGGQAAALRALEQLRSH